MRAGLHVILVDPSWLFTQRILQDVWRSHVHPHALACNSQVRLTDVVSFQIAQLLTVRRQQEIEQGITTKRESRSIERCAKPRASLL